MRWLVVLVPWAVYGIIMLGLYRRDRVPRCR